MITFTNRFLQLFFLGLVPTAFSGLSPYFLWLALCYDVALFLLAALDWWKTPSPRQALIFHRETAEKLSLGAENPVTLGVENLSNLALTLTLKDEFPPDFAVNTETLTLTVAPRAEGSAVYKVSPPRRGDFTFGRLHFRYPGPLGLTQRQGKQDLTQGVKVYPNLQAVRKYDLWARRGRLEEMGLHRTRLQGEGKEFESLRDYTPDDDFRRIHWKATARRGKPITIQYDVEKNQRVFFLLDCGRMMTAQASPRGFPQDSDPSGRAARGDGPLSPQKTEGFLGTPMTKLDYAINACLMMSYLAARFQDQPGMMAFGREILSYLPPHKGRYQVRRILEALYALHPQLTEPNYALAFRHLNLLEKKRSLVVIFTDLIDTVGSRELLRQVKALAPRHLPLFIAIGDAEIVGLKEGALQAEEDLYRKTVATELLQWREEALSELTSRGALVLDVPPQQLTAKSVNKYLEIKGRGLL